MINKNMRAQRPGLRLRRGGKKPVCVTMRLKINLSRHVKFSLLLSGESIIPLAPAIRSVIVTADKGVEEEVDIPLKQ